MGLEQVDQAVEASHKKAYEAWRRSSVVPLKPLSWDDFRRNQYGDTMQYRSTYATWVNENKNPFENTASKKLEPYADVLSSPQKAATTTLGAEYGYTNFCFGKIGQAQAHPKWVDDLEYSVYDPKSNSYPLLLITPQSYYRSHSSVSEIHT